MKEQNSPESGAISIHIMFVLFFLAALGYGSIVLFSETMLIERRARHDTDKLLAAQHIERTFLEALEKDKTPEADTAADPVWALDNTTIDGYTLTIEPVSDRLNPNFIRKDLIDRTILVNLMINGNKPADLQQYRYDKGLSVENNFYADFFAQDQYDAFFSGFGWNNPNLCDEFALNRYVSYLTGSAQKGDYFQSKLTANMAEKKMITPKNLRLFLGTDYRELFPCINTEPLLNINFTDPRIITLLTVYPAYGIKNASAKNDSLLSAAKSGVSSVSTIHSILEIDESNPLYYWFGCTTWFWRCRASKENETISIIVSRIPAETAQKDSTAEFRIIAQDLPL